MNAKRLLARGLGVAVGLLPTWPALANGTQSGGWDHHGMMWGGGVGWFLGPLMMLLFLAAAVAVVVLVVRWLGGTSGGTFAGGQGSSDSARRILDERFARGEIDEEEFRQRKQALEE